jgi:hypothetical protein
MNASQLEVQGGQVAFWDLQALRLFPFGAHSPVLDQVLLVQPPCGLICSLANEQIGEPHLTAITGV